MLITQNDCSDASAMIILKQDTANRDPASWTLLRW